MSDRSDRLDALFHQALENPKEERAAFLAKTCAGDEELRRELESMLDALERAGQFMELPALHVAAQMGGQDAAELPAGHPLSSYRVEALLGRGGMGEVYRAVDVRLDRPVALKVLPAEVTDDPERLRRFTLEAKAASSLSHPNIATIYEIGEAENWHYIAMEYVEGETLEVRLERRSTCPAAEPTVLELKEVLDVAVQIADALQAAHAKGIIHRDIKPANLILTPQGQVKVLDFGLAKRLLPTEPVTGTRSKTTPGLIMGTVPYMSPEQVSGQEVDQRTDLFSFGVVLYNMTTGRLPFSGETAADTMHNILHAEPEILAHFNPKAPPELERIVHRCLEKSPELRYQSANELRMDLKRLKGNLESGPDAAARAKAKWHQYTIAGGVAVMVLAIVLLSWYWFGRQRSAAPDASLIPVPLTSYPGWEDAPSFSPDGSQVVFQWCKGGYERDCDIYIKQIGVEPPFRLTSDPANDFSPVWAPDGNSIAFLRVLSRERTALLIIPQRGGQERLLTELNVPYGMGRSLAWTPDSKWLAYSSPGSAIENPRIILLNVETGQKRKLTEVASWAPAFSPDGSILAFNRGETDICLLRLADGYIPQGTPRLLLSNEGFGAAWMPDGREILFYRGSVLDTSLWRAATSGSAKPRRLPVGSGVSPAVSLHGSRLVYSVSQFNANIWRVDLSKRRTASGIPERLIHSTRNEFWPAYSPDGSRVAFLSDRTGADNLWVCNSDGSNPVQLTSCGNVANGATWSPDGQQIVLAISDAPYQYIYVVSANGGILRRLTRAEAVIDKWPCWSPDGWIYFNSHRSGTCQIWKMSANGDSPVQITPDGANRDVPRVSPDGKFLYYFKSHPIPSTVRSVWRTPVEGGEETKVLESVNPVAMFRVREQGIYFFAPPDEQYRSDICFYDFATDKVTRIMTIEQIVGGYIDVSGDSRSIVYTQLDDAGSDLMLVENFK